MSIVGFQDAAIILSVLCGHRASDDATVQAQNQKDFHGTLRNVENFGCKPFAGRRFAIIKETVGAFCVDGITQRVDDTQNSTSRLHLTQKLCCTFSKKTFIILHGTSLHHFLLQDQELISRLQNAYCKQHNTWKSLV